jgi:hypothetical protein
LGGFGYGVFMRKMRIAVNEGNSRHIAARITHPDWAALGTACSCEKCVSRQMKEIAGILRRESRTLMGRKTIFGG